MRFQLRRLQVLLILFALVLLYTLATGFSMFFRLSYLLALAGLGAYLWSLLALRGLKVEVRREALRVQVGDTLASWIEVTNTGPLPKPTLEVREMTTIPGYPSSRVISLAPHTTQGWSSRTVARRRGVFRLGPMEFAAGDPFGLFQRRCQMGEAQEVLVYPATEPLPGFHPFVEGIPGEGSRHRPAQHTTPNVSSVREYLPTDALNRIHWPSTARVGRLMVKQYDEDVGSDLWVLLDLDPGVQVGEGENSTEERAVTIAASVATRVLGLGFPVGLIAYGSQPFYLPADRGSSQMLRVMDALARVGSGGEHTLARALREEQVQRLQGASLMVITSSVDSRWIEALSWLVQGQTQVMVTLLDPASFGGVGDGAQMRALLSTRGIESYVVRKGEALAQSLTNYRSQLRRPSVPVATMNNDGAVQL